MDITAHFRFYEELNDFLAPERRKVAFPYRLRPGTSVAQALDRLGVPQGEVELILANGSSVDFSYPVGEGDRLSVYPVFESMDITPLLRARRQPLRELRFGTDAGLHQLAVYLRLLGFDTIASEDHGEDGVAPHLQAEQRVLLTREGALLRDPAISRGYHVRAAKPRDQLYEVLRRFDLAASVRPFERCPCCNGSVQAAPGSAGAALGLLAAGAPCSGCCASPIEGSRRRRLGLWIETIIRVAQQRPQEEAERDG